MLQEKHLVLLLHVTHNLNVILMKLMHNQLKQIDIYFMSVNYQMHTIHNVLSLVQGIAAHTKQQFIVYTFK